MTPVMYPSKDGSFYLQSELSPYFYFFLAYLTAKFAKDIVVIGEKALSREIFLQKE
jgi:hypothetical protein